MQRVLQDEDRHDEKQVLLEVEKTLIKQDEEKVSWEYLCRKLLGPE